MLHCRCKLSITSRRWCWGDTYCSTQNSRAHRPIFGAYSAFSSDTASDTRKFTHLICFSSVSFMFSFNVKEMCVTARSCLRSADNFSSSDQGIENVAFASSSGVQCNSVALVTDVPLLSVFLTLFAATFSRIGASRPSPEHSHFSQPLSSLDFTVSHFSSCSLSSAAAFCHSS